MDSKRMDFIKESVIPYQKKPYFPAWMELYVIDGDYGLPSLDIDSVKLLLFLRATEAPVKVKVRKGFITCCLYTAPTLVVEEYRMITGYKYIFRRLRSLKFNLDCGLTARQASGFSAVESLIETKLVPVLAYVQWLDPRNCDELTAPWHMKALPFPFNFQYIKAKKTKAAALIETIYPGESDEVVRECMRRTATTTLSAISSRLGTFRYLNGDTFTSLDVIVYSAISPFIKIPYPSTDITALISMWPNLIDYVKRVDVNYLDDISSGPKYLVPKEKVQQNDDEMSYFMMFLLFTGASTIMLCFAVNKGIIKFE